MSNRPVGGEVEIYFPRLIKVLWRRAGVVAVSVILSGLLAFSCAAFIAEPKYESRAMVYVNNSAYSFGISDLSTISTGELTAAKSLVDIYVLILTSRTTMEEVIEKADLDYTYKQLSGMVRAGAVDETELFEIVCTSSDPAEAELIVDTITEILPDRIAEIVDGSSVRVVDEGKFPDEKTSPNVLKVTVVGIALGFIVSSAAVILADLLNNTVRDEDYLIEKYDLPVAAPLSHKSDRHADRQINDAGSSVDESYTLLRENLLFGFDGAKCCRVIGIVSSLRGEGKTVSAVNIAYSLAEAGKRTLLLDADMRCPRLHEYIKQNLSHGLSNFLNSPADRNGVIRPSGLRENLFIMTAGDIPQNPTELLSSKKMTEAVAFLCKYFDYIIMDMPPVTEAADAVVLSKFTHGIVIAAGRNFVDKKTLDRTVRQLKYRDANILGFVLNGAETEKHCRICHESSDNKS